MKSIVLLFASLLLLGGTAEGNDDAESRILVTFADPGLSNAARAGPVRPGYSNRSATYLVSVQVRRAADRLANDFGLRVVDEWPIVPLNVHCLVYAVTSALANDDAVEGLLAQLRTRPEVESAQRMNEFEVLAPRPSADPYSRLQHNVYTLELLQAHAWSRGDGSHVAIIDTGADFRHPELASQVEEHLDFVSTGESEFVEDAHGTAVAGIIGAASNNGVGMIGIAPSARLSVLKACWYVEHRQAAVCNSFTLAKAISHAIETAPQVINLSLGGPADPLLRRLLTRALENGSVVVAADRPGSVPGFPADVPGVIVVGAASDVPATDLVVAPGEEILVLVPGGGYDYASGSSLSAAHVSGIAALLVARQPGLTGADVSHLLVASRAGDSDSVNACRALASLLQLTGCREDTAARNVPADDWLEAGSEAQDEL